MTTTNMFLNFGGKWDRPPFCKEIKTDNFFNAEMALFYSHAFFKKKVGSSSDSDFSISLVLLMCFANS